MVPRAGLEKRKIPQLSAPSLTEGLSFTDARLRHTQLRMSLSEINLLTPEFTFKF